MFKILLTKYLLVIASVLGVVGFVALLGYVFYGILKLTGVLDDTSFASDVPPESTELDDKS